MRGLQRINTTAALHRFITLWEKLGSVQLTQQPDQIKWRFTGVATQIFFNFRMRLKLKINQQFSHRFKIFPTFVFFTENLV